MAWALISIQVMPRHAEASCYVCDEVVELDNALATCLLEEFDQHLTRVQQSSDNYSSVDLSHCVGSDGSENRGIVAMPVPGVIYDNATSGTVALRTVYIMDEESLLCLRKLVDPLKGKLSPVRQFDLTKECRP
jgi:hypothetical protein